MCEITESESLERRLDSLAAENEGLRAKVARLRERAERAERVSAIYRQASLIPMWSRWSVRIGRFDPMTTWSTEVAALSALDAALGLDVPPAGEAKPLVVSPEQYELGYAVPCSFPIQGGTPIRREPYRLIRRLPDGNYLIEDPSASGPDDERRSYGNT
jgi:hypothetical protein